MPCRDAVIEREPLRPLCWKAAYCGAREKMEEIYGGSSCFHAVPHAFVKASVLASSALARIRRPGAARLLTRHGRGFVSACRWGRCAKGQSWLCGGAVSCAALSELVTCSGNARGPPRRIEAGKRFCRRQTALRVRRRRGDLLTHDEGQKAFSPEEKAEVLPAQRLYSRKAVT